mmetsp:Transcript_30561/g.65450  ORF Transcript_30561/g.65450 Transcript_30561/m.65450 type:complete len:124 (-) Transcript_30561:740-1111(-)
METRDDDLDSRFGFEKILKSRKACVKIWADGDERKAIPAAATAVAVRRCFRFSRGSRILSGRAAAGPPVYTRTATLSLSPPHTNLVCQREEEERVGCACLQLQQKGSPASRRHPSGWALRSRV